MDEQFLKEVAAQLRKPEGELGDEVAEKMNEGNLEMNLRTIEWLDLTDNMEVLEIGMGNGFFVKEILHAAERVHYTGCDYSEDMIRLANQINEQYTENGQAEFVLAKADCLQLAGQSMDRIFTVNTIYFWEDQQAVLKEFKRLLKPDGRILITIRPKSCMLNYPTTRYHFEFFEKEDVEELLVYSGFTVTRSEQFVESKQVEILGNTFDAEYAIIEGKL